MRIYTKQQESSCHPISKTMDELVKDVVDVIGYERMMLLKKWKMAFEEQYRDYLSFKKIQTQKNGDIVLCLSTTSRPILLCLHYEKLTILEKLAKLIGCRMITDIKYSEEK